MRALTSVATIATVCGWFLLTSSGCYMFQKSDSYYGIATAQRKILFVLDVSGSMEGKAEGNITDQITAAATRRAGDAVGGAVGGIAGSMISSAASEETTKLGAAKRELIPAIQGLDQSSRFTIITFGEKVSPWRDQLIAADGTYKDQAMIFLKGLESNGGTPAREALERAFRFTDADLIFFVSDGQPSDASASEILARVGQLNATRHVTIETIGLGDDQDEAFLRDLAAQNGGQYIRK
jgi:uncharacterized protein YegL